MKDIKDSLNYYLKQWKYCKDCDNYVKFKIHKCKEKLNE